MQIIHGENQTASRQYYLALRGQAEKAGKQLTQIAGADCTLGSLVTAAESVSLLGESSLVYIEGIFSRRPSNEKKQIIEYLQAHPQLDILCWEGKDIGAQTKGFPPANIKVFPLPKYLFDFLDTLSVDSYRKTIETAPVEQVFASVVTRIHKVLIGEGKLKKPLTTDQLVIAYNQLLQIDYAQKTSTSPFELATALEVWLLKR